jgi:hypothetical protein
VEALHALSKNSSEKKFWLDVNDMVCLRDKASKFGTHMHTVSSACHCSISTICFALSRFSNIMAEALQAQVDRVQDSL